MIGPNMIEIVLQLIRLVFFLIILAPNNENILLTI